MDRPLITLFSTPLVSTWALDETRRILYDAGDGVSACLDQRLAKVKLVALTHSHRDHIGGLLQFLNLRGGQGDLRVFYPHGNGAIRAYAQFLTGFDRGTTGLVDWVEVSESGEWTLPDERLLLRPFPNAHMSDDAAGRCRSVGYQLIRRVDKLRAEHVGLLQSELDRLRIEKGREALVAPQDKMIFAISGDTTPLAPSVYAGCDYLLHECTFLNDDDSAEFAVFEHGHSVLGDVVRMAIEAGVGHLGLYHISRRYDDSEIRSRVVNVCRSLDAPFPVSVAYPGRYIEDLFGKTVWPGRGEQGS